MSFFFFRKCKNKIKEQINKVLEKIHREDALTLSFFEVNVILQKFVILPNLIVFSFVKQKGIVIITKQIQKVSLYPTQELFKKYLEEYIEKGSAGYINDIGKHKWDSRFYSEYMQIVSIIFDFFFAVFLDL